MIEVVLVTTEATYDLRRRVLRSGTPSADPSFRDDADPATVHMAVRDGEAVVAVATVIPCPTPWREGTVTRQLRGMAVEPARQGEGLGRLLLDAIIARARSEGASVLWANARVSALPFYEAAGMTPIGDVFVPAETGLAHRVVVLDL